MTARASVMRRPYSTSSLIACHRKNEVHRTGHDRVARHAIKAGFLRILSNDETASFSDRLQPKTAVGPGSGEITDGGDPQSAAIECNCAEGNRMP